jgi:crotonobetainyl-CoA:carnitine CoA-transferase CaiB-like acyl-CoA transferase
MGSPIRMSRSSVALEPAPVLGADTEQVLAAELGLSTTELAELARAGAIGATAPTTTSAPQGGTR